jgi:hypothetical protein
MRKRSAVGPQRWEQRGHCRLITVTPVGAVDKMADKAEDIGVVAEVSQDGNTV